MINLGISFHYYWNDYTQLKVGSNGWTSFNPVSNIASCFPTIPTPAGAGDNLLCPLMGDLNFTGAGNLGQVRYWSNNVDTFIISYINVPFWSVNAPGWVGSNSFQIILCNSDSSITYQYGALSGFAPNAACIDMTVGIENSTGAIGLQVHSDAMPPSNYVIRFEYPAVVLLSIQDILPDWNLNTANGAEFIMMGAGKTLSTNIRNAGNAAVTTTINLQSTILDAANATVMTNSGSIATLAAGADSTYVFANQWTPVTAGQYTNRTVTTNSQDINAANNTLNTELDVVNICNPNTLLSYNTAGVPDGSINWNGGANDDGVAVYMQPPVYPYTIASLQYYISSNVSHGYIAQVFDDNGPNGGPGTMLFTTTVPSASVVSANWNTVTVTPAVTLPSGGFYVVWLQGGTTIFLGTESAGPRSHHNYEILDGAWAQYREDAIEDVLIRAAITGYTNAPTAAYTSSVVGQTANFTDATTGLVTSWLWDFGDMTTSTQQNPSHMYAAPGTYTVCLTSASPCTTNQVCQTINICFAPTATYASSTNQLNATFTDFSAGTVTSWSWDFGDSQTSTQQNPSHTYSTPGTYNVCLIVSNNCGDADTLCQSVTVCAQPVASYINTNSLLSVSFMDMTSNSPVSWSWDFGDTQTSNQQHPTHVYASAGIYTVCLIATNSCGDADTVCQAVAVCDQLINSFTATQNEDTVFVSDMSSGSVVSWLWDFGDSQTSTLQNDTHNYATGGLYQVCLTTTDACGMSDSTCQMVMILITGVETNSGPSISGMYPNPVTDQLNVSFGNALKNGQLELMDQTGRVVQRLQNVSGKTMTLNVETLPAGIYLLRAFDETGNSTIRFIKQ
jgi:PKD repeat protein